jgi:hypothetical protein
MRHAFSIISAILLLAAHSQAQQNCNAPALVCKAADNQDRSLYVRDRCRYEQRLHIERFKMKDGQEKMEEVRDTTVTVEPGAKPEKTGDTPIIVRVISDTDKRGNPKSKVDEDSTTMLSFGNMWDLAFFPLLPEKVKYYNFQEVIAERKSEKWYRFVPRAEVAGVPLASGVVMLDPQTGEVLTIRIEGLHNLDAVDKEAAKLRSFNATIDYSQFQGALRLPTLASGGGTSNIRRFEGSFRFRFEERKYVPVYKLD